MALVGDDLGDAIKDAIAAQGWDANNVPTAQETWRVVANVIVTYLKANAVVNPGTFEAGGDSVTGSGTIT